MSLRLLADYDKNALLCYMTPMARVASSVVDTEGRGEKRT